MTNMVQSARDSCDLATAFGSIVGSQHALSDDDSRMEFSQDLIDWGGAARVALVVRPCDTAEVVAVIKRAATLGLVIAPRGGGLSYTAGYVPQSDRTIALDLSRLNQNLRSERQRFVCLRGCRGHLAAGVGRREDTWVAASPARSDIG